MAIGLAAPVSAAGVNVFPGCSDAGSKASKTEVCDNINGSTSSDNPVIGAIGTTITILAIIIGVTAIIMIIIAGLSFITANGDAQSIAKARSSVIYALIGLVVAALAQTLVSFVLNKL